MQCSLRIVFDRLRLSYSHVGYGWIISFVASRLQNCLALRTACGDVGVDRPDS